MSEVVCRTEWSEVEWSEMEWNAGESETTVITAVSIGTYRAKLSMIVNLEFSQHTRFSNNSNR